MAAIIYCCQILFLFSLSKQRSFCEWKHSKFSTEAPEISELISEKTCTHTQTHLFPCKISIQHSHINTLTHLFLLYTSAPHSDYPSGEIFLLYACVCASCMCALCTLYTQVPAHTFSLVFHSLSLSPSLPRSAEQTQTDLLPLLKNHPSWRCCWLHSRMKTANYSRSLFYRFSKYVRRRRWLSSLVSCVASSSAAPSNESSVRCS